MFLAASVGFIGAVLVAVLVLLLLFTSSNPLPLAQSAPSQEDQDQLVERWMTFQHDLTSDRPAAPFIVRSRDFNAFVDMMPRLRSRVSGNFEADSLRCQFCTPLWPGARKRFIHGSFTVKVRLAGGDLKIDVTSGRVNGHDLPRWVCRQLGRRSLNPEAYWLMDEFNILPHLRSVEIRDGAFVMTPLLRE